jgi:RNA polymerase sigma-70 factor (ECF subfamily)
VPVPGEMPRLAGQVTFPEAPGQASARLPTSPSIRTPGCLVKNKQTLIAVVVLFSRPWQWPALGYDSAISRAVVRLAFCEDDVDEAGLESLLQRACRHDPEALSRLVELFSPRVYGLLLRLTGVRDVADDLLQETFLRVVRMIGQYQHVGKFESWLFRIAANVTRDRARRLGRRSWTGPLEDEGGGLSRADVSDTNDPPATVLRTEAGEKLAAALGRLSDAEREVILLRHYSELPFREIADMLGVPLGTALARAHRALKRLRTELGAEDEGQ